MGPLPLPDPETGLPARPGARRTVLAGGSGLGRIEREQKEEVAAEGERRSVHFGLRITVIGAVVAGLFAVLVIRLWSIQVIRSSTFRSSAIQTLTQKIPTYPPRGLIVARGGQVLAGDVSEEVVTLKPAIGPDGKTWVALDPAGEANISALLGISEKTINADLNNVQNVPHQPVPIAIGVPVTDVIQITEHQSLYPGVAVSQQYIRTYPQHSTATQLIGYVGQINASEYQSVQKLGTYSQNDLSFGQTGLEATYEHYLYGVPGFKSEIVDPLGNPVSTASTTAAKPGDTVVLNMDLGLEHALSSDLANQLSALRAGNLPGGAQPAPSGAAAVIDVRTGAVVATASMPTYDNNLWVGGISQANYSRLVNTPGSPLNNYAVQSPQQPGSTFKLISATAGLDTGIINPGYVYDDTGSFTFGIPPLTLHNSGGEVLGPVNVTSALTVSSDVFFYNLGALFWTEGARFGATPIQDMARRYGIGSPSGIDLAGTTNGQVDDPALRSVLHSLAPRVYVNTFYEADNVEMAFGQGLTQVTPMLLANAYATFANGGTRYAPELAAGIVSPTGTLVKRVVPKVMAHVPYASSYDYNAILTGLEGAVQNPRGTAYAAFAGFDFSKWNIAGKTGTATPNKTQPPTSWFVAFGGPQGKPFEYAVAVEVYEGGFGAQAAAPVVRQVFQYLMAHPLRSPKLP